MTKDDNFLQLDFGLSDKEIYFIGQIVALWGALEHEIFNQTLLTFDGLDGNEIVLPKEMNNLQFTGILEQWKKRVVDKVKGERAVTLQQQLHQINNLKEYRNALVHGMWKWSSSNLNRISTVRIRKKEIITVHFTVDDLQDFYNKLAGINFKIRYPGGLQDLASERAEHGFHISRRFLSMITDNSVADDWLSKVVVQKDKLNE